MKTLPGLDKHCFISEGKSEKPEHAARTLVDATFLTSSDYFCARDKGHANGIFRH